ncbi:MAG: RMD1 family protein [Comamonadaceae bacterium]|nr:RMD1 family protein [Comamonadaceae bacterium]
MPRSGKALLRELGDVLLIQSRMVGRAEVSEKPDITWELPVLDRLYDRLAVEFELRDREQALTRKLELIQLAANNYLNLLNGQRTLRVEWYIVILILAEILLILYELAR